MPQSIPRIESGAYTLVREHFDLREMHLNIIKSMLKALCGNAAIGREMGF